jgi:hypothetical protein
VKMEMRGGIPVLGGGTRGRKGGVTTGLDQNLQ